MPHSLIPAPISWTSHFPNGDLWVFGYGGDHRGTPESPGRVVTVIEQSFWETLSDTQNDLQQSTSNLSVVWGAAYHIPASHAREVHAYLDEREIDGYTVHFTLFHPSPKSSTTTGTTNNNHPPTSPITCMVYIGLPTNAQFLRNPADRDPASVARVISQSRGLSGENRDYLYLLEKALEGPEFEWNRGEGGMGVADGHVADLARRVRAIEGEKVSEADRRRSEAVLEHLPGPQMETEEKAVRMEEFEGGRLGGGGEG
ncbi:hypothetical protein ACO22_07801 [Paracoccidioides brasiliensis]|uniref:glutathione-specific gamma-glutamylcyclotransferase n=1 Tax=Paracoccidioides brasiliensis TaxID=121759 RepID=A0A1D2J3N7_PARBR|nr:hypothetical protein ACO22_07801 [Paracoccidioides brasiliensis]ODH48105.1 hypothetical protein GX48_05791 [Paracoccidioides brasiliensis]